MRECKNHRGVAIMGVGALHTGYAIAEHLGVFRLILQDGVINAVEGTPARESAFWFLICGLLTLCVGSLIHSFEASRIPVSLPAGMCFLLLSVLCVIAIPASGAWLLLPPAVSLVVRKPS